MDSRNVNINNGNFASFSMNSMQNGRIGPQYDPRGPPHHSYPSSRHGGPYNPPPHPLSRQHSNGGGSSYYNHVDNSVHDSSSVQYGNTYTNNTHNMNGVANIGSIGNANFGANYGSINQSSNGMSYGSPPPPNAPPHHRGSSNPFLQQGPRANGGYDSYPQDTGHWDRSWHGGQGSQYGNGGSGQFIHEAEVNVRSTHVQRASSNPFRTAAPVSQAKPSDPPPSAFQPRRSASSQGESMDRDRRTPTGDPPRPPPAHQPSVRVAPSKASHRSGHDSSRTPSQRRSIPTPSPPASSDEESEDGEEEESESESESESEDEEPLRTSQPVRATHSTKAYAHGRPAYIVSGSTTSVVSRGSNRKTGSGSGSEDSALISGNANAKVEVPKRTSSSAEVSKVVLRRQAPASTDTDTDVEEAKKIVAWNEAQCKKVAPARTPTENSPCVANQKVGKEPVQSSKSAGSSNADGYPPAKKAVPPRESRRTPKPVVFETSSDEEGGERGGFQWEIPDSESESSTTLPPNKGKGREVSGASRPESRRSPSPVPTLKVESPSDGGRSPSTSRALSASTASIVDDDDSDVDELASLRQRFNSRLLIEDDCQPLGTFLVQSTSVATSASRTTLSEAGSANSLAPPQYTPDPDTSATVQASRRATISAASNQPPTTLLQELSSAESSSSAQNRMSSASVEEVDDTQGDLQVEGKLKVKKKGIIRGLKSVFKDSKGKKAKRVSFEGEGGVVGAPGVRGD